MGNTASGLIWWELNTYTVVMHKPVYTLNSLFAQLGLESSDQAIDRFIASHPPIPDTVLLHEASCWNEAQSAMLREAISCDADWAEVVDQLDTRLRKKQALQIFFRRFKKL